MTSFNYKARDHAGALISGRLEAENSKAVALHLEKQGLSPVAISVEGVGAAAGLDRILAVFRRVNAEELVIFTRQLASTLEAGVPLTGSLEAVAEQIRNNYFRKIVLKVKSDIEEGSSFSDAMDKNRAVFSPLIINMVRAGEKAGILPKVLDRVSNLIEKDLETVGKVKTATRYPLIVLVTLIGAFILMSIYVIPKFSVFFASFKTELPLPTRILMGINVGLTRYWHWMILAVMLAGFSFRRVLATEKGRYGWDRFILSTPIFGDLFSKIYLSRFGRMLSSMLNSGIPILDALTITAATVENKVISKAILNVRDQVSQGKSLTVPMKENKVFPPIALSMLAIGEKAGTMENMLEKMADYFDREIDYTIKNLTPLLEPIMIFGLGILLLIFALGIFVPMWDLVKIYKSS